MEEVIERVCRAVRRALTEPEKPVPIEGFEGYWFEFVWMGEELIPGLHVPPKDGLPRGSFDLLYGAELAAMCGVWDFRRSSNRDCVIDAEDVEHMIALYRRGWFVRVWKQGKLVCWAELVAEAEEAGEGDQSE